MITIEQSLEFSAAILAACPILKSELMVSSEEEFSELMETVKDYPLLLTVMPSSRGDEKNLDNRSDVNEIAFFVLDSITNEMSMTERRAVWALTQNGMEEVKDYLRLQIDDQSQPYFELMESADFGKRGMNPEYNILGLSGWSLAFAFVTY